MGIEILTQANQKPSIQFFLDGNGGTISATQALRIFNTSFTDSVQLVGIHLEPTDYVYRGTHTKLDDYSHLLLIGEKSDSTAGLRLTILGQNYWFTPTAGATEGTAHQIDHTLTPRSYVNFSLRLRVPTTLPQVLTAARHGFCKIRVVAREA